MPKPDVFQVREQEPSLSCDNYHSMLWSVAAPSGKILWVSVVLGGVGCRVGGRIWTHVVEVRPDASQAPDSPIRTIHHLRNHHLRNLETSVKHLLFNAKYNELGAPAIPSSHVWHPSSHPTRTQRRHSILK